MKSWDYFRNYGHKIGAWVVLIRISLIRCIWLVHIVKNLVGIIRVKWGAIWITIKIEKIIVISHITQDLSKSNKEKQTNKQTKRKSNLS